MRLERQVVIDAPLGHAWRALLGSGSAEPRRGTLTLADVPYRGTLRLLDRDDDDHVVSFQARAAEDGGLGTATAIVRHRLDPFGERTRVSVEADLALTGQGARVERGRLQDDAARIIDSTLHDLVAASSARAVPFEQRREYRPALVVGVAALVALVVLRRVRSRL